MYVTNQRKRTLRLNRNNQLNNKKKDTKITSDNRMSTVKNNIKHPGDEIAQIMNTSRLKKDANLT